MKKFQVDHLLHKQIRQTTRSDCLDWPRFDLRREVNWKNQRRRNNDAVPRRHDTSTQG
jgi:hypothetical protein